MSGARPGDLRRGAARRPSDVRRSPCVDSRIAGHPEHPRHDADDSCQGLLVRPGRRAPRGLLRTRRRRAPRLSRAHVAPPHPVHGGDRDGGRGRLTSAPTAQQAYTTVFHGIADGDGANALFHCTAGKDRTGWANATLLTALGVPRDTVMDDYLASNTYRAKENAATLAAMPPAQAAVYKPMLDVRPEYLNSGFQEVTSRYGTFDRYLDKALGLSHRDVRDLREDLLVG
jgi:hypothetical protein